MENAITLQIGKGTFRHILPQPDGLSPREIILNLDNYPLPERNRVLSRLSPRARLAAFLEMDSDRQACLLKALPAADALRMAALLPLHVWIRLAGCLPPALFKDLERALSAPKRRLLKRILTLPADSTGRILRDDCVAVNVGTEADALVRLLNRIRQDGGKIEPICVVRGDGRYLGILRTEALATVYPRLPVERLIGQQPPAVSLHTNRIKAARLLRRYDLSVLPVVDDRTRLVGVIRKEDLPRTQGLAGSRRLAALRPTRAWQALIGGRLQYQASLLWLAVLSSGVVLTAAWLLG